MNKFKGSQRRITKRVRKLIIGLLLCAAAIPAADAAYLLAKAELAQFLIARAWGKTLNEKSDDSRHNANAHRPWPWADTHPVARLQIASLALDTWVLNGATGTSLAFGPGLTQGSGRAGENGLMMISAHRDTHFKDLADINIGDQIKIQNVNQQWHRYRVTHIGIADSRVDHMPVINDKPRLALITCYPFNAILPGGPLRYVIEAEIIV